MVRSEETTVDEPPTRPAAPRGVIVLALLLYVGAFVSAVTAAVVATPLLGGVPRSILLLGAFASAVLATGLLRRRRWAWFATLVFVAINGYYLLLATALRGQNSILGLTILTAVAAYLFWPSVRSVYLRRDP